MRMRIWALLNMDGHDHVSLKQPNNPSPMSSYCAFAAPLPWVGQAWRYGTHGAQSPRRLER